MGRITDSPVFWSRGLSGSPNKSGGCEPSSLSKIPKVPDTIRSDDSPTRNFTIPKLRISAVRNGEMKFESASHIANLPVSSERRSSQAENREAFARPTFDSSAELNHLHIRVQHSGRRRGFMFTSPSAVSEFLNHTEKPAQAKPGREFSMQDFAKLEAISKASLHEHREILQTGRPNSLVDEHARSSDCLVFDHLRLLLSELDIPHHDSRKPHQVAWAFEGPSSKPKPSPVFDSIASEIRQMQSTEGFQGRNLKERIADLSSARKGKVVQKPRLASSHSGKD